jgi:hypothetical protein
VARVDPPCKDPWMIRSQIRCNIAIASQGNPACDLSCITIVYYVPIARNIVLTENQMCEALLYLRVYDWLRNLFRVSVHLWGSSINNRSCIKISLTMIQISWISSGFPISNPAPFVRPRRYTLPIKLHRYLGSGEDIIFRGWRRARNHQRKCRLCHREEQTILVRPTSPFLVVEKRW